MTHELTHADLVEEAVERFGADAMQWAFQCPNCGDIATCREFLDATGTNGAVGQECIGRHVEGRGCDWTAYGLIPGPWAVTTAGGKVIRSFPLAPAPEPLPYVAIGNSEPIPTGLPDELLDVLRAGRTKAGWCDHGSLFGSCCEDPR